MYNELSLIASLLEGKLPSDWASSSLQGVWQAHYSRFEQAEDEFAADHYQLFGLEVFPYASVYLSDDAQMGGDTVGLVADSYRAEGWYPKLQPDHFAAELRFLVHLLDQDKTLPGGEFLSRHLLPWVLVFSLALERQRHPFFSALAQDLQSRLAQLVQQLEPEPYQAILHPFALSLLEDEEVGLKDIALVFLTPASAGFYLSRADQMDLSVKIGVPAGFGTRSQILPNLFRSAAEYEKMPDLLQALE